MIIHMYLQCSDCSRGLDGWLSAVATLLLSLLLLLLLLLYYRARWMAERRRHITPRSPLQLVPYRRHISHSSILVMAVTCRNSILVMAVTYEL